MTPAQLPVSLRQPVHSRFDVGKTSLRVHIECHQLVILWYDFYEKRTTIFHSNL